MEPELQGLVKAAAAVLKEAGAKAVYLFGSAAQDRMQPGSDIDMAVTGLQPRLFFRAMGQAEDILQRRLDLIYLGGIPNFL